ncbi:MAG TPA: phage tail protein [Anaerolineaceae bacterium]
MAALIQEVSGSIPGNTPTSPGTQVANAAITAGGLAGIEALQSTLGFRFDPAPAYLFYVELSGLIVGLFTECSGISLTRDTEPIIEGGVNNMIRKLPGRVHAENIRLKRGLSLNRALYDWFTEGSYDFKVKRINFSIIQGAPGHNLANVLGIGSGYGKIKQWDLEDAFPVKYEISELATQNTSQVVIETLEIAHNGISLSYEAGTPMSTTSVITG